MSEIKRILPNEFIGHGEVKGFQFSQMLRGQCACLYEVKTHFDTIHFEVFIIKVLKIPQTNDLYESYPKANSFGVWAWTYTKYTDAVKKFKILENIKIINDEQQ